MTTSNKTLVYKKIPDGLPVPGQDLVIEDRPIDTSKAPARGLLVKILSASMDPYLRGRMRDPKIPSYSPALRPDDAVPNSCVASVLRSDSAGFAEGDLVVALMPIGQYAALAEDVMGRVSKVGNPHGLEAGHFLGALGMPGLTAYSSYRRIGRPQKGETIFVSSAAGAVGQVVGQLARHDGLTVVGSVGSDEKLDFITNELDFHRGFNYKKEKVADALKRLAPDGIDIYFDNVGGEHLDASLDAMKKNGRVIVCGMISDYNKAPSEKYGVKGLANLIAKGIKMEGFLVGDPEFGPGYRAEHQKKVQQYLAEGTFKAKLDITEGIEKAPETFVGMLEGKNFGKTIVKIADA